MHPWESVVPSVAKLFVYPWGPLVWVFRRVATPGGCICFFLPSSLAVFARQTATPCGRDVPLLGPSGGSHQGWWDSAILGVEDPGPGPQTLFPFCASASPPLWVSDGLPLPSHRQDLALQERGFPGGPLTSLGSQLEEMGEKALVVCVFRGSFPHCPLGAGHVVEPVARLEVF